VGAWLQLGLLRVAQGDDAGAADAFQHAAAIRPQRADAAYLAEHLVTAAPAP
jgi:cytochrome c-type biogenesis protein CcmH/NrfG